MMSLLKFFIRLTESFLNNTIKLMVLFRSKNIVALGIVAFLVMSFWSLSSMSMDMTGHLAHCPFMDDSSSFCQMSISEHISQWQQIFTVVRGKSLALSLLPLLVFLCALVLTVTTKAYEKLKYQRFRKYFYRYKPELKLFDYLLSAFSQGLIHPKIYA